MLYYYRQVLLAFAGVILLAAPALSTLADEYLNRAAAQYRDKDFGSAYTSAEKSSDQIHRSFVLGMAALRMNNFEEAVKFLGDAELKLPLIADYAVFFSGGGVFETEALPGCGRKSGFHSGVISFIKAAAPL